MNAFHIGQIVSMISLGMSYLATSDPELRRALAFGYLCAVAPMGIGYIVMTLTRAH